MTIIKLMIVVVIILAAVVIVSYPNYIKYSIVVAIIGILATLFIPAYQEYLKNSKLSEARVLFAEFRTKIMSIYSDKGSWPTFEELKNAGVMFSGTYVESAVYNRDIPSICYTIQGFDAATGNKIGGSYQNQGTITAPKIMWGCEEADNPNCVKYVPARYLKCWCDVL